MATTPKSGEAAKARPPRRKSTKATVAGVTTAGVKAKKPFKSRSGKVSRKASARKAAGARSAKRASRGARHHHHVYVIELQRAVWMEPGFRKANPDGDITRPAVYVGMTGLTPDVRFDKHMAGIQAGRYVQAYGLRLLPELYEAYNPMPYEAALEMEVELAIGLREQGYGVWQA
jgi:hypothetical protein